MYYKTKKLYLKMFIIKCECDSDLIILKTFKRGILYELIMEIKRDIKKQKKQIK